MRIVCGSALLFSAGGISDLLDVFIARHSGTESEFVVKLDTAADAVFVAAVLIKINFAAIQEGHYIRSGKEVR